MKVIVLFTKFFRKINVFFEMFENQVKQNGCIKLYGMIFSIYLSVRKRGGITLLCYSDAQAFNIDFWFSRSLFIAKEEENRVCEYFLRSLPPPPSSFPRIIEHLPIFYVWRSGWLDLCLFRFLCFSLSLKQACSIYALPFLLFFFTFLIQTFELNE